ncbi:restriction endonuclease subunit S [Pseudoalteromonas peptidolytica]|uniref:Type I restriction enzyme, S subunit n=1 Tax=Pseudoalteromonas peptidolytica F12-50-A1 TaxID=1315280 RepID=A0A8I0MUD5_9GAMM|nr:restriction endonuclease subunit S [Pseudoalteromonas peptidolytica]MBE0346074.1 type I restriction enzyme, S subunit [Pseudoalteromonas peptidolytica F12-50-A1]NLR17222.1 restriction endonuclease subunit S [Pseudoalteromonas peptidolytica]GEK11554.1 type I restriction-modification protein subunit S [Pseudoalteromonas peptidolytica]
MSKYKAYPDYKRSNIEWFSCLPSTWKVSPIKYLFNIVNGSTPKSGVTEFWDGDIVWVTPADLSKLSSFKVSSSTRNITEKGLDSCGTTIVPKGSLVLSTRAPIGSLAIADYDLCTNQGCKSLVTISDLDVKYFYYYLSVATEQLNLFGRGTTFLELSSSDLGSFPVPVPSQKESRAITNFLDHETAKIDTLIEKQQQLIKLLKEKRQAVISHAVTKGLNPEAPMKDSGVEWLGKVPEHWGVSRLKFECDVVDCRNKTPEYFANGEYFVVRTTNVKNQKLNFNAALFTDQKNFEIWTQRGIPPAGSILFTREAPTGEVCIVPENLKFCMGQRMMNFISNSQSYTNYLFDYLISDCLDHYINSVSHGSTVSHLRVEQVENIPVPVPPEEELIAIHEHIGKLKTRYNAIENNAFKAIKLMQERRTALISAAVTGKIDVRNWQKPEKREEVVA